MRQRERGTEGIQIKSLNAGGQIRRITRLKLLSMLGDREKC